MKLRLPLSSQRKGRIHFEECKTTIMHLFLYPSLPPLPPSLPPSLPPPLTIYRGEVSLLSVWKNALELFVWNKSALNSDHEFAIVILKETAHWVSGN